MHHIKVINWTMPQNIDPQNCLDFPNQENSLKLTSVMVYSLKTSSYNVL